MFIPGNDSGRLVKRGQNASPKNQPGRCAAVNVGRPFSPFRGFKRSLLTDLKERPSRPPWRELRP
eukprot:3514484-Prymnesium_polylepis.1